MCTGLHFFHADGCDHTLSRELPKWPLHFYNGQRALQPRTRYQIDILTHVLSRHTDAHKTMS